MTESFRRRRERRVESRIRRRYIMVFIAMLLLLAGIVAVPMLARNRNFALSMIQKYGGLGEITVDVQKINLGWFFPLELHGLTISDGDGQPIAKIESVKTELGLWRLATDYTNLRTIQINAPEIFVAIQPGTTSIEQALQPLLDQPKSDSSAEFTGKVVIADGRVHMLDMLSGEQWDLNIVTCSAQMPTSASPIPPVVLEGTLAQVVAPKNVANGAVPSVGSLKVNLEPAKITTGQTVVDGLALTAGLSQVPLEWWQLAKRRVPELPIDSLLGTVSLEATGEFATLDSWKCDVQSGQVTEFWLSAPTLIGEKSAHLQQVQLAGGVSLANKVLTAANGKMLCDFGSATANGYLPWPVKLPAPTTPWIDGAELDVTAKIDASKLLLAAPTLVKMRDQARLVSGEATMTLRQTMDPRGLPQGSYNVQLGDLVANVAGQVMRWDQPLTANLAVQPDAGGNVRFVANCSAEFCNLQGEGGFGSGRLIGKLDLDRLQQRLAKWVELPLQRINGSADCTISWQQTPDNRWTATGQLQTTPLLVQSTTGGRLTEPAWRGTASVVGRTAGGQLTQLDRAELTLAAEGELVEARLLEPMLLVEPTGALRALPPGAVTLKLAGDLAAWQRRLLMWQTWQPEVQLAGKFEIDASGVADIKHLELKQAAWRSEPFQVNTPSLSLSEPKMTGKFAGRIDTQDLTRLEVQDLLVQAESFAVQAADAAAKADPTLAADAPSRPLRVGQAAYRLDLGRLMQSVTKPSAAMPVDSAIPMQNAAATSMLVTGEVTGQASWTILTDAIQWKVSGDGKDIRVSQRPTNAARTSLVSAPATDSSLIWEEPRVKAIVDGRMVIASGLIELSQAQVETPWIAANTKVTVQPASAGGAIRVNGACNYNAADVANRLRPWIGDQVQLTGTYTAPIDVVWASIPANAPRNQPPAWCDGLQATTRIGWQTASVAGIQMEAANVPVSIQDGIVKSAAEVPVSGGNVAWDLTGDLRTDPIQLELRPGTVINNVAITPELCHGWIKYVAPLLAETTSIQGRMSLKLDEARLVPTDLRKQTIRGQLAVSQATVGPGPLANEMIRTVQALDAIRKGLSVDALASANTNATNRVWMQMPEQQIDFSVVEGRVAHRNLNVSIGDVNVFTSGTVDIDSRMELLATIPIRPEWVQSQPLLQPLANQPLQIPVRGSLTAPQMDIASIRNLARGAVQNAVQGAVQNAASGFLDKALNSGQSGLNRGLERLFGPNPAPQPTRP